jgi:hypothetical protein
MLELGTEKCGLGSAPVEHRGRSAALQDSDSSNSPSEAMRSLLAE